MNNDKAVFYSVLNNALPIEMEDKQFSTHHALASYLMAKTSYMPMPVCQAILNQHAAGYEEKGWATLVFAECLVLMEGDTDFRVREL